jgi:surface carbohydrate biosynthesis protein
VDGPSHLLLPVESRVRELDAKLLLAGVAAERGFPVVLGGRAQMSFALPHLPRGVFFAKSMRFTSDLMTGFIQGFGHHIVASDEESLVRFDHPEYYGWRFSERTFGALRHLFAWGQDDAEMLRAYPGSRDVVVHATGNPRMDLLREDVREVFRGKADALRREHGAFIMVNTNFPFVNNFVPALNLIQTWDGRQPEVSRTGRGMSLDFALSLARHQQHIAEAFQALMPKLSSALPDRVIVLRPHPSEDHDRWRRLTKGLPNVRVIHQDSVVPWLMAADVLVHNGCTTAVEAAVLGTPAVAYLPVVAAQHDYHLPNSLSTQRHAAEDVVAAIGDLLAGAASCPPPCERRRILARHLETSRERLASERIVDVLQGAGYLDEPPPRPGRWDHGHAWVGTHVRTLVKRVNLHRPGHRNSEAYLRHRFPALGVAEVNLRLRNLGETLDRFGGISATSLGPDLFSIAKSR